MSKKRLTSPLLALGAVATLLIVGVAAIPQQRSYTFAYLESELILRAMPEYAQAESTFAQEVASMEEEVRTLSVAFDSAVAAFQQQEPMLTPTVRDQRRASLQQMQQQAQTRQQELSQRAQQRNAELLAPLEARIQAIIDGLRAERGYGLIFDVSAPGGAIVAADPSLNLTNVVVQRLTAGGP